jgi:hypothetical protein
VRFFFLLIVNSAVVDFLVWFLWGLFVLCAKRSLK